MMAKRGHDSPPGFVSVRHGMLVGAVGRAARDRQQRAHQ